MSNSYVKIYIASAAMCREIICTWEYFRKTVIQNPCTFILSLQSKDRTKDSTSKVYTEFSKETKNQCQVLHLNSEAESVGFQTGLSPGQGGCWFLPQISAWGQRHLEGASDPRNLQGEGGKPSPLLHVAKHGCQRIHSSKHWKLPKKLKKNLLSVVTRPKSVFKMKFPAIQFSVSLLYSWHNSSHFLPILLIHPSWTSGR